MMDISPSHRAPIIIGLFGCFCLISGVFYGIVLIGLAIFLAVARLPKADSDKVESVLETHKVSIIAHRGAALDFPENTLSAFREAKKSGADAVEFDIEYTAEGRPVIFHDDTVDRTTDGTGHISKMSFEECRALSASCNHNRRSEFPKEKIPSLEETIALCLELDLRMYIDVKSLPDKSAEVLSTMYKKHPELYSRAIVTSFHPIVIYKVRKADAGIVTGLTWRPWFISCEDIDGPWRPGPLHRQIIRYLGDVVMRWAFFNWLWYFINSAAVLIHRDCVSKDLVKYFSERNIQVVAWTVNDAVEKRHFSQNFKISFMTDTLKN